ncbi:metal ABC transporter solute-binding protein, Zn/Mn family [Pirellulaceae bacterium SH449]
MNRLFAIAIFSLLLASLLFLPGCEAVRRESVDDRRLKVVATTGMIADLVRQIGGEHVRVEQLIRNGIDPHLYRPVTDDVRSIARADVVFYNGLNLEGRMLSVLRASQLRSQRVPVCERLNLPSRSTNNAEDDLHSSNVGHYADPHCWMDVSLWIEVSQIIEDVLVGADNEHAPVFRENGVQLRQRLADLDLQGRHWIESIPESQRILISTHDAFRYFGERYGIEVQGVHGISTASEAGLHRVEELVRLIADRKVPAVFVESSVSDKSIRSLIEGAGRHGFDVQLGGELFTDSTGPEGEETGTYEGMMRHNFRTITNALGGRSESF